MDLCVLYMHEDMSMLQRCIPNCPKTGVVTPCFWVVSFGFLSICPFYWEVCLPGGTASTLCSAPDKLQPFTDFKDVVLSKFLCLHESRLHYIAWSQAINIL